MKTFIDNLIEEIENQTDEVCDHCGKPYDSNSEGHEHFEDGGCECKYCINGGWKLKGLKFCSPECEMNYIYEDDKSA